MTDNSTGRIYGATKIDKQVCQCSKQNPVPDCPTALPFTCTSENNDRICNWLLVIEYYDSSLFNTCPHPALRVMAGPPTEIHLKDNKKPVARHKIIPVPIHWQGQVHSDLLHDMLLDVIERVVFREPVELYHHMAVARKHNRSPRQPIDLPPLNKHCQRETHNAESPFHLARLMLGMGITACCCKNLITFVISFGWWCCKRAPQGFVVTIADSMLSLLTLTGRSA